MYRSIRAAGWRPHFACSVLSGPPAHGTMLQKIYIRTLADGSQRVKNVCRASLFHIRALRHIRLSLTEEMANVVACALVQSWVDYANSLYIGMSCVNFDKLQLVQITLARVDTLTRKWDHIQPSLKRLSTLQPICQRVNFKVTLLTYSIRHSGEPDHLNSLLMDYKPTTCKFYGLPKNIYLLFHG